MPGRVLDVKKAVVRRPFHASAAAGTGIVTIRITNVSRRSCRLQGRPAVAFLNAAGRALRVAEPAVPGVPRAAVPLLAQGRQLDRGLRGHDGG
jgi:Protein of unknown function (DUF4232)